MPEENQEVSGALTEENKVRIAAALMADFRLESHPTIKKLKTMSSDVYRDILGLVGNRLTEDDIKKNAHDHNRWLFFQLPNLRVGHVVEFLRSAVHRKDEQLAGAAVTKLHVFDTEALKGYVDAIIQLIKSAVALFGSLREVKKETYERIISAVTTAAATANISGVYQYRPNAVSFDTKAPTPIKIWV